MTGTARRVAARPHSCVDMESKKLKKKKKEKLIKLEGEKTKAWWNKPPYNVISVSVSEWT